MSNGGGSSRKAFLESQGATCANWTWSWSFVIEAERIVVFGMWDDQHVRDAGVILGNDWSHRADGARSAAYGEARRNIDLIVKNGHALKVFRQDRKRETDGSVHHGGGSIAGFQRLLEPRVLVSTKEGWCAVRPEIAISEVEGVDAGTHLEGRRRTVLVEAIERDGAARRRCIELKGTKCAVCAFDFPSIYGDLGDGFIHVHHIRMLADADGERKVDPERDLVPLCPNCHAMIHRRRPMLTLDELRALMAERARRHP